MTPVMGNYRRQNLILAALILAILVLWELFVWQSRIQPFILPAPSSIGRAIWQHKKLLLDSSLVTFSEMVAGLAGGLFVGVMLAVLFTQYRLLRELMYPLLIAFEGAPKFALAPILIVWTGFGFTSKAALAAILVFFPVTVHMSRAMLSVGEEINLFVRSLQTPRWKVYTKVLFPSALPSLFDAMRQAIPLAMVGAVIGEFISSQGGLGHTLISAINMLNMALGFAAFLLMSAISAACYLLLMPLEQRLMRWLPPENR